MRGVGFQAVEQVEWIELPDPRLESPRDAIVAVELAGLCGSDLHPYFGREEGLDPGTVMGHEFVGRVLEVGSEVKSVRPGDRVFAPFSTSCGECFYCRSGLTSRCVENQLFGWRQAGRGLHGGQAQLVRVPCADGTLMKVPAGLSDRAALLLGDNYSTGYFCAELAGVRPDGVYAVIGCGTVGLLAILAARQMGAEQIVAIDPVAARRQQAESLGAIAAADEATALDWVRSRTAGRGADAVLELVGLPAAQRTAYQLARPGGILSVIGCHCTPHFAFSPVEAYDKNLTYRTGRCPARHYMDKLTGLVVSQRLDLDRFITHEFSPRDCQDAYRFFSERQGGCLKAAFVFN
jgi:2-desacetyl-2-hydroxyethyl bacteriochlorophyllide A dehydrogenase